MPEVLWFYAKNDRQLGPVTPTELKKLAETGTLLPENLIWREGMESWAPAAKVKGLFPTETPREPPAAPQVVSNGPTETMPPGELAAILSVPAAATPTPQGVPAEVFFTPTPPSATLGTRPSPTPADASQAEVSRGQSALDLLWLAQVVLWGICIATVFLGGILFAAELASAESPAEETAAAATFATFFVAAYVIARAGERVAYLVQIHFERRRSR